jgi:hypothetical protein
MLRTLEVAIFALALVALVGCTPKEERFESACQLVRRAVVEEDAKGNPELVDVELEWDPCPGEQVQIVRGGVDFAKCMAKYEIGDLLPVRVLHQWDERGYYKWDLYQVGDCTRPIEVESEGSYEKSQECESQKAYGRTNGFNCSRRPFRELVRICPWTAR